MVVLLNLSTKEVYEVLLETGPIDSSDTNETEVYALPIGGRPVVS